MKIILAVLFISQLAFACPTDSFEREGGCVAEPQPSESALAPMIAVSNEKPPADKMPSYQREGIHVDDAKPGVEQSATTQHDLKGEREQR